MTVGKRKTVIVLSGGLDSTTLLYHLIDEGHEVKAISADYDQRHTRELEFAAEQCALCNIEHRIIDLRSLTPIFSSSSLTNSSLQIPSGEYQDGTIQLTTVPNRNMIFLSIAIGWAINLKFNAVAFGAHASLTTNYPDCTVEFAQAMDATAQTCDWSQIRVLSPFIEWSKGDIVRRGLELGVPYALTWSCYEGTASPCGKCSTCIDRHQAFAFCHAKDPLNI